MEKEFHLTDEAIDRAAQRIYHGFGAHDTVWAQLPPKLKKTWRTAADEAMTAALGAEYVVITRHQLAEIITEVIKMLREAGSLDPRSEARFAYLLNLLGEAER